MQAELAIKKAGPYGPAPLYRVTRNSLVREDERVSVEAQEQRVAVGSPTVQPPLKLSSCFATIAGSAEAGPCAKTLADIRGNRRPDAVYRRRTGQEAWA